MTDKRPVNLAISTIQLPITAYASILHRITGVVLVLAVGWFLYLLDGSLSSPEGFAKVAECLEMTSTKLAMLVCLSALNYHLIAGIKHLIMDLGIGESLQGGVIGARLTFLAFMIATAMTGVWLW